MATQTELDAILAEITQLENLNGTVTSDAGVITTATAAVASAQAALDTANTTLATDTAAQTALLAKIKADVSALT